MLRSFPPLATGPSIYEHVRAHLDSAGRLVEPGLRLPDEEKVMSGGLRWVAGAMDGAFGHHAGGGGAGQQAADVARLFVRASTSPSKRNLRKLYEAVADDSALDFVDPMLEDLARRRPDHQALHDLGRWLATTASDRGAVKIGIAIIGVTGTGEDVDVLRALGAHDEFTLFAAVALGNSLENPDSELWALASAVDGWGRIQCVERLRNTKDPEIQAWILREGFRNSIMYEYLAYIAATSGGLLVALRSHGDDRELLTAAGEILDALIMGGPAEDIDDYEEAANAVEAYLALMQVRAETLGDLQTIATIRSFLGTEGDWDARAGRGWTASRREAFEECCDEILGRDEWNDRIAVGLLSESSAEFWLAERAARRRGVDTFDIHVDKIRRDALQGPWFQAWEQADTRRAHQLVDLARTLLPLEQIASGPADARGMGPEWQPHTALMWTLQALRDHPGIGSDLVLVGLQSPVVQNRNMSLKALEGWPRAEWPTRATELVEGLAADDPNEKTKRFASDILAQT